MQTEWLFIGIFLAIGLVFPAVPIILAYFISPHKSNPLKNDTYECGIETVGEAWVQFKAQYYVFALVFVVFDVETVFLFPWAVAFKNMPFFMVFEGIVFIALLVGALVYIWRKGALEWV